MNQEPTEPLKGITLGDAEQFLKEHLGISYWNPKHAVYSPLASLQHSYADHVNSDLKIDFAVFLNGRSVRKEVTRDDMREFGPPLIQAKSPLLQKLSTTQALSLYWIDPKAFEKLVKKGFLSPQALKASQFLFRLLAMDSSELSRSLEENDIKAQLTAEPLLIDALSCHVPFYDYNRDRLSRLKRANPPIPTQQYALNKRDSANSYYYGNDNIEIETKAGSVTMSKRNLSRVSDRLREEFLANADNISLSHVDPAMISMLKACAQGDTLTIDHENIWIALATEKYFQIDSLAKLCDHYINAHNLLREMTKKWLDDDTGTYDADSLSLQWEFCRAHRLTENKDILANIISKQLNNLTIKDDAVLRELIGLPSLDIQAIFRTFDFDAFNKKLESPEFLGWVWSNSIFVRPLKRALIKFCKNPKNEPLIKKTWTTLPDELVDISHYSM